MRLINADELIPLIKMGEMNTYSELGEGRNGGIAFAIERINQMPTIEERKNGKWEMKQDPYGFFEEIPVCSECGHTTEMRKIYKFCPNCGADMREEL